MTLDECEDAARRVAMSMPPSDFASTRAIQAFAQTLRAAILKEREACAKVATDDTSFMMLQDFGMQQTCEQVRKNIANEINKRK